jgi:putative transposase
MVLSEVTTFTKRSLAGTDYVYYWVDEIHLKVGLEQDKVCLMVMIGVRADGAKELIAPAFAHRDGVEGGVHETRHRCKAHGRGGERRSPVLGRCNGALRELRGGTALPSTK